MVELEFGNDAKFKLQVWTWPFEPKSIGFFSCLEQHVWSIINVDQRIVELKCRNNAKFKLKVMLTSKSLGVFHRSTRVKYHYCRSKDGGFRVQKQCKIQTLVWPWPYDPKINRDRPQVFITIVYQRMLDLEWWLRNNAKFKVQIWPWPLIPKSSRQHYQVMGNIFVKYWVIIVVAENMI